MKGGILRFLHFSGKYQLIKCQLMLNYRSQECEIFSHFKSAEGLYGCQIKRVKKRQDETN